MLPKDTICFKRSAGILIAKTSEEIMNFVDRIIN